MMNRLVYRSASAIRPITIQANVCTVVCSRPMAFRPHTQPVLTRSFQIVDTVKDKFNTWGTERKTTKEKAKYIEHMNNMSTMEAYTYKEHFEQTSKQAEDAG